MSDNNIHCQHWEALLSFSGQKLGLLLRSSRGNLQESHNQAISNAMLKAGIRDLDPKRRMGRVSLLHSSYTLSYLHFLTLISDTHGKQSLIKPSPSTLKNMKSVSLLHSVMIFNHLHNWLIALRSQGSKTNKCWWTTLFGPTFCGKFHPSLLLSFIQICLLVNTTLIEVSFLTTLYLM